MASEMSRTVPVWVAAALGVAVVALVTVVSIAVRPAAEHGDAAAGSAHVGAAAPEVAPARDPIRVPLFVDPATVHPRPRFLFTYDAPAALAELRATEKVDEVVRGAADDLETFRRLTAWARAQFEPGVPSPYPPLDARIILRDVRSGFTGGFCAQYNYVLVQALQSLGYAARYVTVARHEVAEAFSRDARRWVCLDPLWAATYVDEQGRALAVVDLHRRARRGAPILPGPGALPGAADAVRDAFAAFAVWIKNDHVGRPVNFTDLERYKVRYVEPGEVLPAGPAGPGLVTPDVEDLYFDPVTGEATGTIEPAPESRRGG